jgi:hypothetical protein
MKYFDDEHHSPKEWARAFSTCVRCDRTAKDLPEGVDMIGNLTTFWQREPGIGTMRYPTLCTDCMEDIRTFASTKISRA